MWHEIQRLNGQPYLETRNKELMLKKEVSPWILVKYKKDDDQVGEVVANVQLLLSPFLSSLSCKLVKDQENQYSFFGVSYQFTCQIICATLSLSKVRQVFSAKTLSQGEECQVYADSIGIPLEQNSIGHVYYARTVHIQLDCLSSPPS